MITPDLQERLYPYLGGIARENKMKALSIKEHHRVHSFKEELIAFLEKHGIEYKEWMLD